MAGNSRASVNHPHTSHHGATVGPTSRCLPGVGKDAKSLAGTPHGANVAFSGDPLPEDGGSEVRFGDGWQGILQTGDRLPNADQFASNVLAFARSASALASSPFSS